MELYRKSDSLSLSKKKDSVLSAFNKVIDELSLVASLAFEERSRQEQKKTEIEKEIQELVKVENDSNNMVTKFTKFLKE